MQLSARNKVFIAGIVGAALLIVGFNLLTDDNEASQNAPGLQFPGREQDGVPGTFYLASTGIGLLAASGFISGVWYSALDRVGDTKSTIVHAMMSGAAAGLLIFLAACAMTVVGASSSGLDRAAIALFTGAFDTAPLFVAVLLLLAAFGALGGAATKLALIGLRMINNKKA